MLVDGIRPKPWKTFLGKGRLSLSAREKARVQETAASQRAKKWGGFLPADSQRSGAPGDIRSPADGRKQAEFTSAVKHGGRRASLAGSTVCLAQSGVRGTNESFKNERKCRRIIRDLPCADNKVSSGRFFCKNTRFSGPAAPATRPTAGRPFRKKRFAAGARE